MQFGSPQCGVSLELPAVSSAVEHGVGGNTRVSHHRWALVSADRLRNVWLLDDGRRDLYCVEWHAVLQWTVQYGSGDGQLPDDWLSLAGGPIVTVDVGDEVLGVTHGESSSCSSWTWVATKNGAVILVDSVARRVLCHHRLGVPIQCLTLAGSGQSAALPDPGIVVATIVPAEPGSRRPATEVVHMTYRQPPSGAVVAKAKGLLRVPQRVVALCVLWLHDATHPSSSFASSSMVNDSVLSINSNDGGGAASALLLSVTEHGDVDVWDLGKARDRTHDLGAMRAEVAEVGEPTCAAVSGGTLWIGTSLGKLVVFDVFHAATSAAGAVAKVANPVVLDCSSGSVRSAGKRRGGSVSVAAEPVGGQVVSLLPMTLGRRIWASCSSGTVTVWSVARRKLCGAFDMQAVPITCLTAAPNQLLSSVWSIDAEHTVKCWEVREDFLDVATVGPTPAAADASVATPSLFSFVETLCHILSGAPPRFVACPAELERVVPEAQYLPDALTSLSECRTMLQEAFHEMTWETLSLSEDVQRLCRYARTQRRAGQRANDIASRLTQWTPAFPIPDHIQDPVERLVMASECVLEELADLNGMPSRLAAPSHPELSGEAAGRRSATAARSNSKGSTTTAVAAASRPSLSLDDSLPPEASSLSTHILETQLQQLREALEKERAVTTSLRHELDKTKQAVAVAAAAAEDAEKKDECEAARSRLQGEVDRLKKALGAAKRKAQVVDEQNQREKETLKDMLDEAQRDVKRLRLELEDAQRVSRTMQQVVQHRRQGHDTTKGSGSAAFVAEADRVFRELLSLTRRTVAAHQEVREAATAVLEDLSSTTESFHAMEAQGMALVRSLKEEREEAVHALERLKGLVASNRSIHPDSLVMQLNVVLSILRGEAPPAAVSGSLSPPTRSSPSGRASQHRIVL